MSKIRCLIVDDEPLALDVLSGYIAQVETLQLAGRCENALEAMAFLQKNKADLLFLDIQMPKLNGLDLLKVLPAKPKVIFTTAHRDHAVEGFELNALDYLLKPVSFERFLAAVNKYHSTSDVHAALPSLLVPTHSDAPFIYLKAEKKMVKVFLKDILYIESLKDYIRVKTTEKEIITWQRITSLEEKLPDEKFLRIHRSYIIAIDRITAFNHTTIELGALELPIGRQFKPAVMRALAH
ncbi:response regulator transcription factor [Pseudoflavitalea sp. G-6-1-2]|uniref:LytR/AlgR family response regulator transcription factor n=1 Tax=Pseudoflavitalea sp. G-6-1-2 TaxID=2728841 RepID=UPI00146C1337|nr:LytTR family DNA-binding domain-containing protein [Pseudoflavitalea sp. G-6-1-2]NML23806.1 response regulator transcription factor [Pseudoflavitalea sp. G-6-1-2]